MKIINIFWLRRDLRLTDNAGLYQALKSGRPVLPIFIFDRNILDRLEDKTDRRVEFIEASLINIQSILLKMGTSLEVHYGHPIEVFNQLLARYKIEKVFANHDYDPYALERDHSVEGLLNKAGVTMETSKDHVLMEKEEVLKDNKEPYTVFTPYRKKWKKLITSLHFKPFPTEIFFNNFYKHKEIQMPSLASMGFKSAGIPFPSNELNLGIVQNYGEKRNFPAIGGTSKMSLHLRFGTVSIRAVARTGAGLCETFLNELIWRDFYQMILWHFPRVGNSMSFKPEYDLIEWRKNEEEFEHWCNGNTGYPIVDAGMRELNATGFMHNRVRMIVASFLSKHLLLDWRLGEAYFAKKLLDFDLAANNGGWQWAAGSGCDAAPYFRIFNPSLQTRKFDPGMEYIRKWVPEFTEAHYPKPIVEHDFARKRCLQTYSKALKSREADFIRKPGGR